MDATTRTAERAAGQGDPQAARRTAKDALRRGDRLAACLALAAIASGSRAEVVNAVRDELAALIPCPVGAWVTMADYRAALEHSVVLRPRAPCLTDRERAAIDRAVA